MRENDAPKPRRVESQKSGAAGSGVSSKYEKLVKDMNLVKGNINLTNMMLDASKPADV